MSALTERRYSWNQLVATAGWSRFGIRRRREAGIDPFRYVVEQVLHGIVVRPTFAVGARNKHVLGACDCNEILIGTLRNVQKVFTIGYEVVTLHRTYQDRNS